MLHRRVGDIFCLVIGALTPVGAYKMGLGMLRHPGPGFIFFVASLLIVIFGAIDLAGTFIEKPKMDKERKNERIW